MSHGTIEEYRLHRKREEQPCDACEAAKDQLAASVRRYQAGVRGTMPAVAPQVPFSTRQRAWWPALRERDREPLPEIPAVTLAATPCAPDAPFLPSSPKSLAKKARAAGWWVRTTRAIGPRIDASGKVPEDKQQVATIAVAAARGDDRLVWVWKYILKTVKGVQGWHWELDEVSWNKAGLIDNTKGRAVLDA